MFENELKKTGNSGLLIVSSNITPLRCLHTRHLRVCRLLSCCGAFFFVCFSMKFFSTKLLSKERFLNSFGETYSSGTFFFLLFFFSPIAIFIICMVLKSLRRASISVLCSTQPPLLAQQ